MGTHRAGFTVVGDPEGVYEATEQYFHRQGFLPEPGCEKPRYLYLKRGTALGRHHVRECKTTLFASLTAEEHEVHVECRYEIRGTDLLLSDRDYLQREVDNLRKRLHELHLQGKHSACPQCLKPVNPEFTVCPYCGANLHSQTCPKCSKPIQPDFAVCPYCGTNLREKTISL
ncbi:MAG: zinc ribbon domain-containing protein [Euryarchaeota archaeon]|nr:zinc ribbon domain-containing protein [Euryarchaeota archaeon]